MVNASQLFFGENLDLQHRHSHLAPTTNVWNQLVIFMFLLIGVVGNAAALWILYRSSKRRNRKHVLMLRCLALNDIVAQIGMLTIMVIAKFGLISMHRICVGYVILRSFGLGSGCVALVMALERWLALTRPFSYHQIVTYRTLKRFILTLWCGGALLTILPLFGFGIYFSKNECRRYRDAETTSERVYAYTYFVFGTTLVLCIAYFNITVICELCRIRSQGRILVRRTSRPVFSQKSENAKYQTPEEVAFAKLMAVICIIFTVCWIPQMVSIPMAQYCIKAPFCQIFSKIANALMCAYFTLDPFIYVLQRHAEKGRFIWSCFFPRRSDSSNGIPTVTTMTTIGIGNGNSNPASSPACVLLLQPTASSPTATPNSTM